MLLARMAHILMLWVHFRADRLLAALKNTESGVVMGSPQMVRSTTALAVVMRPALAGRDDSPCSIQLSMPSRLVYGL